GGRRQPQHPIGAVGAMAVEPVMAADLPKASAQRSHVADEIGEIVTIALQTFPADPAGLVVLAIGVVVAALRVADLIAGEKQRRALRQQEAGQLVFAQASAQRDDGRIVARALVAAIVAVIVVGAVAIVFAVGLVVLLVVAEQVGKGESIVDGDVIDAGMGLAAVMIEQVR